MEYFASDQIANSSIGLQQSTDQETVMQSNMWSQQKKHISFSKKMFKSETTHHFVLRIPKWFCDAHLRSHDDNIVLVDESQRTYDVRYVMKEHRFQRGWRDFVIANGLLEGDTLVFDLIDECKFKVHITKASTSIEDEFQLSEALDFGLQSISGDSRAAVQSNMSPLKYTFRKKMHKSNLSDKFYLRLPKGFCAANLPCHGANIILVDESEREYSVKYAANQNRLQCGWKDFATARGLLEGDTVDFNLVEECKFKVHITRTSKSMENELQNSKPVDLATQKYPVFCGHTVDNHQIQHRSNQAKLPMMEAGPNTLTDEHKAALDRIKELEMQLGVGNAQISSTPKMNVDKGKWPKTLEDVEEPEEEMMQVDRVHCWTRKRVLEEMVFEENTKHVCTRSESTETSYAYGDSSLNVNDIHSTAFKFKEIKGFEDFKIQVNGETLDSEIPAIIREKYYQLCCFQKEFIHASVMKGHSSKFVAAMIYEIVSIADAIKAASMLTTSRDYLECMEKNLKSFEDLGMSVSSLRAKIGSLITFFSEQETIEETTRTSLAEIEREKKAIEEKRAKIDKLEEKVDALNQKREKLGLLFNEVAGM